jgi:hypothetical protein
VDFIDWCDFILIKLIELSRKDSTVRSIGVDHWQFTEFLLEGELTILKEDNGSTFHNGIVGAVTNLQDLGLVEQDSQWKVTRAGRTLATDMLPLWWSICQEKLEPEHEHLLHVVNHLSPHSADGYAWVEGIDEKILTAELGWSADPLHLESVAKDLEQWGYVSGLFFFGGIQLAATYRGLVWETKQGFTRMSQFLDDLVAEWETTSVDFKREVHLDTADQKAEFIKDVLSLATTKASGQRWMVIGFDDRSRTYYGAPDQAITQNRIEQILARYATPCVDVQYTLIDYRGGSVGMLEVIRDPQKLPYKVARSIGEKKRIKQGDIYVRHGSQVEKPTPLEEQALIDEGNQARSNP